MVKDHSDSEKGNPLHHIGYSFWLTTRVFYMYHPIYRITHTMVFVTPVVEHWLQREIAQWVHHEGSIWWPNAPWVDALAWSHISLPKHQEFNFQMNKRTFMTIALVGPRNTSMGPPWRIDTTTHCTISRHSTLELHFAAPHQCYYFMISSTKIHVDVRFWLTIIKILKRSFSL